MKGINNGSINTGNGLVMRSMNKKKKKANGRKKRVRGWARRVNNRAKKKRVGQPKAAKHFMPRPKKSSLTDSRNKNVDDLTK